MQDHFLFDDEDPKQRGKGCDALYAKDSRLKFKWMWPADYKWIAGEHHETKKSRTPIQISEVVLKNGWCLKTIFWHTEYEAEVECHGNQVTSYRVDYRKGTKNRPVLLTRLNAQLKAEELFEQLGRDIIVQVISRLPGATWEFRHNGEANNA